MGGRHSDAGYRTSRSSWFMACLLMPRTFGEHAWTGPVHSRKLQDRHMRHAQLREAGGVELADDPTVNRLGRNAQQRADQHLVEGRRWGRG